VFAFRTSTGIADAYGIAVGCDMLLTTFLAALVGGARGGAAGLVGNLCGCSHSRSPPTTTPSLTPSVQVMITVWRLPVAAGLAFYLCFTLIEGALWSAALLKIVGYGWFAILIASLWAAVMAVWAAGSALRRDALASPPLDTLLNAAAAGAAGGTGGGASLTVPVPPLRSAAVGARGALARARGVAIFYTDALDGGAPPVLAHLLARLPVLYQVGEREKAGGGSYVGSSAATPPHPPSPRPPPQVNIFLTNRFVPLPDIAPGERLLARDAGVEGFFQVVARCAKGERGERGGR